MYLQETFTLWAQCISAPGLIFPICKMERTGVLRVISNNVSFIGLPPSLEPGVRKWAENKKAIYANRVSLENEAGGVWHIQPELSMGWLEVRIWSSEGTCELERERRPAVEIISLGLTIGAMREDENTQRLFKLRKGRGSDGQGRRTWAGARVKARPGEDTPLWTQLDWEMLVQSKLTSPAQLSGHSRPRGRPITAQLGRGCRSGAWYPCTCTLHAVV